MDVQATITELDELVHQTCRLWAPGWIAYNWRNYTYDHIQRVRGLAVNLAQHEGGDRPECALAALLHDLTKPYDGEYLTDGQGKRLVDESGFWVSATRQPLGANEVTRLYDRLHLAGQVHSRSSAALSWHLLRKRGFARSVREHVAEAVSEHLGPGAEASPNALCLYDADLIDANIGLPAFVRHIYIHRHFYEMRRASDQPALADLLAHAPQAYVEPYVREALPRWIDGKAHDFPPQLRTAAGRQVAQNRLTRIHTVSEQFIEELAQESAAEKGSLAVLLYLLQQPEEPSIADEIAVLSNGWASAREMTPAARQFIDDLAAEAAGAL